MLVENSSNFERIFSAFSLIGRCRSFDGETNDMLEYMNERLKLNDGAKARGLG